VATPADLENIREGLRVAGDILRRISAGGFSVSRKSERDDPVTEADLEVDAALRSAPACGWSIPWTERVSS
jgi:fructose-1,6-bisphosphatase/inositol monophosphatase family enzyme